MKRVDIKAILDDPDKRKDLMVSCIMAMQEHEGRNRNWESAERAYYKVLFDLREKNRKEMK